VRKLFSPTLHSALVAHSQPSENWRDETYLTTVWRVTSATEYIDPGFIIVITISPTGASPVHCKRFKTFDMF